MESSSVSSAITTVQQKMVKRRFAVFAKNINAKLYSLVYSKSIASDIDPII
jgi:hypothetical protein